MKTKYFSAIILLTVVLYFSCKEKEEESKSERFILLTQHAWTTDSLLADGEEAGGPGELLYSFSGEAKFNEDGTGKIGIYEGKWFLNEEETTLSIQSDSLPSIATTLIEELTASSLKVTTIYPSQTVPMHFYNVRMTFIPK